MEELIRIASSYLPLSLGYLFVLGLAASGSPGARGALAAVLGLGGFGLCVLAVMQGPLTCTLDVETVFFRGEGDEPEMYPYVVEQVTAPGWAWPSVAAAFVFVSAIAIAWRRKTGGKTPSPAIVGGLLGIWMLLVRLALEKVAAPEGLVAATGLTWSGFLIPLFLGSWSAKRGASPLRFLSACLGCALIQRLALIGISWVVTMLEWGTHLDVNVLEDIHPPFVFDHHEFGPDAATEKWRWGILYVQLSAVPLVVAISAVLGSVPYFVLRKRAGGGSAGKKKSKKKPA